MSDYTLEELRQKAAEINDECIVIQQALDRADFKSKTFDRDWFARARAALKIKRGQYNELLRQIGLEKKSEGKARAFERCFVDEARRILTKEQFSLILLSANEAMNKQHGVALESPEVK